MALWGCGWKGGDSFNWQLKICKKTLIHLELYSQTEKILPPQ